MENGKYKWVRKGGRTGKYMELEEDCERGSLKNYLKKYGRGERKDRHPRTWIRENRIERQVFEGKRQNKGRKELDSQGD